MGAFGAGPFDNDDAADWLGELEGGATSIRSTLEAAEQGCEDDVGLACQAVAAAALVAIALDSTLRAKFCNDAFTPPALLEQVLASAAENADVAARCLAPLARSSLAELWGDDRRWWDVLRQIGRVVGAAPLRRPRKRSAGKQRKASSDELVATLGLPKLENARYFTTDEGDIRRVSRDVPYWELDRLAETVCRAAFAPELGFDYEVDGSGNLARRRYDPKLRAAITLKFKTQSKTGADEVLAEFRAKAVDRLDAALAEVRSGVDLGVFKRRCNDEERLSEGSSVETCTEAEWAAWRAEGEHAWRASYTRRLEALRADYSSGDWSQ